MTKMLAPNKKGKVSLTEKERAIANVAKNAIKCITTIMARNSRATKSLNWMHERVVRHTFCNRRRQYIWTKFHSPKICFCTKVYLIIYLLTLSFYFSFSFFYIESKLKLNHIIGSL